MKERCCSKPCCPPEPNPPEEPKSFAQFSVLANPSSGSKLPMRTAFVQGDGIYLEDETTIVLKPGYLYLIDYVFLAVPEADGYMEIVPYINGTPRLLYAFFAPTGKERNTSASAGFTTNEAGTEEARLSIRLDYPGTTRNIDISGAVSVTALMEI